MAENRASEPAQATRNSSAQRAQRAAPSGGRALGGAIIAAGAMSTAVLIAFSLSRGEPAARDATLEQIAVSDLDAAGPSLYVPRLGETIADAKSCKAPLAMVAVSTGWGAPDTWVRIKSGSYTSPPFKVTTAPQRIPVPFPAPYAVGHGTISVIGEAGDLTLWISPAWHIRQLEGSASLNVVWKVGPNC